MIERSLRQVEWRLIYCSTVPILVVRVLNRAFENNSFYGKTSKLQASSVIEIRRLIRDGERGANR